MKWKYILKRILIAIPTFFGITILAYFILNMAPGSPLDALLADPGITPAELERKRVALGLDQPVIIQYFTWLKQLLTGNLGFSYSTQRPVATMILERLPATAILAASSIVLSFQQIGGWVRHMRSSMLEVMQDDYIRTAKSKGLTKWKVIMKHALKNALTPVVTVVGMSIPSIVGGAVVTEQVFGWPGIGSLMVTAINGRDYPVIMGITVMIAAAVLIANILTDVAYGILDPRISYK